MDKTIIIEQSNTDLLNNIGILDPEGKNPNPLTESPYSDTYREEAKIWSNFPAYANHDGWIQTIAHNQVVLVVAGTGVGKTVLFPKYLLHVFGYDKTVVVTQPKQVLTVENSTHAAKTLDVGLGKQVGYQYKGHSKKSSDTKLLYVTDGLLVAWLLDDINIQKYNGVIIDEVHERKVNIDLLMFLLKKTLHNRSDFKVILMSATVDAQIFKDYFSEFKYAEINLPGVINYKVDTIFTPLPVNQKEVMKKAVDIMQELLLKDEEDSHIIFFVTSQSETKQICKYLKNQSNAKIKQITDKVFCAEFYSGITEEQKKLAQDPEEYKKEGKYKRKLIVATNVAESSLTVKGIKYVIDTGLEYGGVYDPVRRATTYSKYPISQAQAKQRRGRTGRTNPGICYHMYNQIQFNSMKEFPDPEIKNSDISKDVLRLMGMPQIKKADDVKDLLANFIQPPGRTYVKTALEILDELGAIDRGLITPLGNLMTRINANTPMAALALIYGLKLKCSQEILVILSVIDAGKSDMDKIFYSFNHIKDRNPNVKESVLKRDYVTKRKKFSSKTGDHLSLFKLYNEFLKKIKEDKSPGFQKTRKWCHENLTHFTVLQNARRTYRNQRHNLIETKVDVDLDIPEKIMEGKISTKIVYCFAQAYLTNLAKKSGNSYTTPHSEAAIKISRNSVFHILDDMPQKCIYEEYQIRPQAGGLKHEINIVTKI